MSFFRTLLWWLLLAALGALAWEQFSIDPGQVVIRWHGSTLVFQSLAVFLACWGLLWFGLWALWTLLRLPFTAWHRLAQTQARKRLVNGLLALNEGRYTRAEALLAKAAEDAESATVSRLAARQAALRRGDLLGAAMQQAALAKLDPLAAALESAHALLGQSRPEAVIELLQPWQEKKQLQPRGQLLRGEALVSMGRASEALTLLTQPGNELDLAPDALAALETRWQAAALRQSVHADDLHQRWLGLHARLRENESLLLAYAQRAGQLGLEAEAADTLAGAIDREWNEALVREFGLLPAARNDVRLDRAQAWLAAHPASPALGLALGRLLRVRQQFGSAAEVINRAIAQGAGAEAWEELGHVYTADNDAPRAQSSYANALRLQRGEPARALGDRSMREIIADEAV
ncbi:MAG: heme biosynthesis protein HemY, partial [Gammaproteobacteria bacterium]|nr:heme biosynthesis protein HemY [Gammaproteobacteria bacterium]